MDPFVWSNLFQMFYGDFFGHFFGAISGALAFYWLELGMGAFELLGILFCVYLFIFTSNIETRENVMRNNQHIFHFDVIDPIVPNHDLNRENENIAPIIQPNVTQTNNAIIPNNTTLQTGRSQNILSSNRRTRSSTNRENNVRIQQPNTNENTETVQVNQSDSTNRIIEMPHHNVEPQNVRELRTNLLNKLEKDRKKNSRYTGKRKAENSVPQSESKKVKQ